MPCPQKIKYNGIENMRYGRKGPYPSLLKCQKIEASNNQTGKLAKGGNIYK
jgi:hypothetical protein